MARHRGRIHAADRNTNNEAPILGADVQVSVIDEARVQATEDNEREEATCKTHRRRIKNMYDWFEVNYPDYFVQGTRTLSDEEMNDASRKYYHYHRDLIYEGINVKLVKAFLASQKIKANGKTCSYVHLRKFNDAILFGAEKARQELPSTYYSEMKVFLQSFLKETKKAKEKGDLDETEADPISFVFYSIICDWAINLGLIFVWVFTVLQWNCMARSASIDPLGFKNFTAGTDSIKITYFTTKMDKTGEKVSPKNLYANPFNALVCPFLALGVWICLNRETLEAGERLFIGIGKIGSAAHRYCENLANLFRDNLGIVHQYVRPDHANTHGLRKGSAGHVTSSTTCPPPLPSVARRGEWSLGKIFDIYWQFGEIGDQYLGRCLAGLDPNKASFAVLPPHFTVGMENEFVSEAMRLCFGRVPEIHDGMTGILLFLLASMIHHAIFLRSVITNRPGHPFCMIPILNNAELLSELTKLVTTLPSEKLKKPTGIPPHVEHCILLHKVLHTVSSMLLSIRTQTQEIRDCVVESINSTAEQAGNLTHPLLIRMLDTFQDKLVATVDLRMAQLNRNAGIVVNVGETNDGGADDFGLGGEEESTVNDVDGEPRGRLYAHGDGKLYDVPKRWKFPTKPRRRAGWELWLKGDPGFQVEKEDGTFENCPVRPFRKLNPKRLPKALAAKWKNEWKPIFELMAKAPTLVIPKVSEMTAQVMENLFEVGTTYVKSVASYIWELPRSNWKNWSVGEWCKRTKRSAITKNGNASDLALLPPPSRFNREHSGRTRRVRVDGELVERGPNHQPRQRQSRRLEAPRLAVQRNVRQRRNGPNAVEQEDGFTEAFGTATDAERENNAAYAGTADIIAEARRAVQHPTQQADNTGNALFINQNAGNNNGTIQNAGDGGIQDGGFRAQLRNTLN